MELRIIHDVAADGAWNLSIDEALFESAAHGIATVRFYRWLRPTLSLGYFQRLADRSSHASSVQVPVVRRSTGGGAIVHDQELTYSFTAPLVAFRSSAATRSAYDSVHRAAAKLLTQLGVPATLRRHVPLQGPQPEPFLCFLRRADGDVVVDDTKVLGSAQRRSHGALLQHGSLILRRSAVAPEILGLEQWLPDVTDSAELADAWSHALGMELASTVCRGSLTDDEQRRAELIQATRFKNSAWTERR